MTPLLLRYGGMRKRLKVDQETLLPAEAHVCFLLLFRNDPTHLKTAGAQDHLTDPTLGRPPACPGTGNPAVVLGGKWSSGLLETLAFLCRTRAASGPRGSAV